jgi:hypothetical protein
MKYAPLYLLLTLVTLLLSVIVSDKQSDVIRQQRAQIQTMMGNPSCQLTATAEQQWHQQQRSIQLRHQQAQIVTSFVTEN